MLNEFELKKKEVNCIIYWKGVTFWIQMCFIAYNYSSQSVILTNFFFSFDFWLIDLYWHFKVK